MTLIRVGTRDSALALKQTEQVINRLSQLNPDVVFELVPMKTTGDKILDVSLAKIGQKGLFTKELESALLNREIDIAVHSLKDMPTELPPGCHLAAVTERIDHRDVMVSREGKGLDDLPRGARVGTSSLRRKAQLLNYRPDLLFYDIRGNVPTRLLKMQKENLDALVIAAAGLERLDLEQSITQRIPENICLPAVGQGALGLEARSGDEQVAGLIRTLHHCDTGLVIAAERAFLRRLGGGCQVPIAALGSLEGDRLRLRGLVAETDGKNIVRGEKTIVLDHPGYDAYTLDAADNLGVRLAEELLDKGAGFILESVGLRV